MNSRDNHSKLLVNEYPLIVLPSLAVAIGLNEAIMLQQIHYWLGRSHHEYDGRRWMFNSYEEWHAQLPFFSVPTIRRTIAKLVELEFVVTGNYAVSRFDRTLWYSINYEMLNQKFDEWLPEGFTPL